MMLALKTQNRTTRSQVRKRRKRPPKQAMKSRMMMKRLLVRDMQLNRIRLP